MAMGRRELRSGCRRRSCRLVSGGRVRSSGSSGGVGPGRFGDRMVEDFYERLRFRRMLDVNLPFQI